MRFFPVPLISSVKVCMVAVLALSYIYYFPVLYMYMWKQRKARIS